VAHLELIETLIDVAGQGSYRLVPFPPEKARIDIGSVYSDYSKIKQALGWQPATSLRQGLAATVAFYREHRELYW
jgi:nucleoside-diphosphate-sugar epimerase